MNKIRRSVYRLYLTTTTSTGSLFAGHLPSCSSFRSRQISSSCKMSSREQTQKATRSEGEVIFEEIKGKGVITLNRPKALNALNLSMIESIFPVLKEWESANKQFVIIKAEGGKAFCAGGDIKSVTDSAKEGSNLYKEFFKREYFLNNLIGTLTVPYIALIDGITMGGGVGLSVHGPYRLFPDVGGSYFLPRLGGKLGLYLALTGYRLKGGDTFKAGVATHMCQSNMLPMLEQDLISLDSHKPQDIEQVLKKYHDQCPDIKKPFSLDPHMVDINKFFNAGSVEEIISNLNKSGSEWGKKTAENLGKMSPTSLKISLKLLEVGATLDLQECLQIEYRLTQRCCEDHDFIEGVRALLVDKDQNPKWKPNTLEGVTNATVDKYFSELPSDRELAL
ncbi:3-hydroxyisobutyryl-CoA hydrolase, mitochondrial [Folsomia candida]|uniref:3-hydroxyisobutyryl-CoA hydrolase, mitochondrial n=1 Tax=Folsomia candida TaxID=158441 RepID=A0A226EQU2_FOLCA|nr:3-hydroxyisobutyryl-CoA hydrolase, mitochondrial [Folsomia candida]